VKEVYGLRRAEPDPTNLLVRETEKKPLRATVLFPITWQATLKPYKHQITSESSFLVGFQKSLSQITHLGRVNIMIYGKISFSAVKIPE